MRTLCGLMGLIMPPALPGNLGGLVVALVVQALVDEPLAAFLAMAAVSLLGVPLATQFPSPDADL